jgi:hypothetical protein
MYRTASGTASGHDKLIPLMNTTNIIIYPEHVSIYASPQLELLSLKAICVSISHQIDELRPVRLTEYSQWAFKLFIYCSCEVVNY